MSVTPEQAAAVLQAAARAHGGVHGGASGAAADDALEGACDKAHDGANASLDPERLALAASDALLAHPDDTTVQWHVREACQQRLGGALPQRPASHGQCRTVWIRPQGWDVVLAADGLNPIRLPMGSLVQMEIEPDRRLWDHQIRIA